MGQWVEPGVSVGVEPGVDDEVLHGVDRGVADVLGSGADVELRGVEPAGAVSRGEHDVGGDEGAGAVEARLVHPGVGVGEHDDRVGCARLAGSVVRVDDRLCRRHRSGYDGEEGGGEEGEDYGEDTGEKAGARAVRRSSSRHGR